MNPLTPEFKQSAERTIQQLKDDLKSIRTGRATPALLENLQVDTYGGTTKMPLSSLATISTKGPTLLEINPFDKSILQDIERAILTSPLGLSPKVQGQSISVTVPSPSQEQREKFVKLASQKVEEKKNMIRALRDETRRKIKAKFENKEVTEDEKFRFEKEIDNLTQASMEEIQSLKERKEEEIRQI